MEIELPTAVTNTLWLCVVCCLLAVPSGTLLALLLVRTNLAGRRFLWLTVISQLAIPLYVFAGGWSSAVGTQGWVRALLPSLVSFGGFQGSLWAVASIHTLAAIPWVSLIMSLGLIWSDRGQDEVAMVEGGTGQILRRSVLPRLRVWGFASCLFCCLPLLTEMVVSNLYQVSTVAEQVYVDASRGTVTPWTYLAAAALCMLPFIVLGWLWQKFAPAWRSVVYRAAHHRPQIVDLRAWRWPVSALTSLVVLCLVMIPIVSLLTKAGWKPFTRSDRTIGYGWSVQRLWTTAYESLTMFGEEFYWSTLLAIAATSTALMMAGILYLSCETVAGQMSRRLAWRKNDQLPASSRSCWPRHVVSLAMLFLIAVPGPLAGMLMIFLLNRSTPAVLGTLYDTTLLAPIAAQQFRLLPLAWLLLLSILATIDVGTREQQRIDGGGWWRQLRYVLWPQTAWKWFAAIVLLFVASVGELSCTILVLPPGVTTLSMRLFEMLHFGMRHQDSGLCGVLIGLSWLVALALWNTQSSWNTRRDR